MARVVHFELYADDPQRAVAFYEKAFGWKIEKWQGPIDYWLAMTGPDAVYYTVDGSDPRRSSFEGGPGVADSAIRYNGSIPITESVLVKARSLVGGQWSALAEAQFTLAGEPPPLRVSEILYHPHNPVAGSPFDDLGDEPEPNGGRVNQGAYGGTAEASRSLPGMYRITDLNKDGVVDIRDHAIMPENWLKRNEHPRI